MRVIHFYHWGYFAPITTGSDVIASNQLEYFHARGWEVDCVLLAHARRNDQAAAFRERYPWLRSVQLVVPPAAADEWSLRGQLACYSQIARSQDFQRMVADDQDLFLTNHVAT